MKIIQVINSMISNKDKITGVLKNGKEYFFLYDKKYKWSITKSSDEDVYYLHFYPANDMTLLELSRFENWQNYDNFITYNSVDHKAIEAEESFKKLYLLVSEKLFDIDKIFDDIIGEDKF
jgi:hypothetical protein